MLCEPCAEKLMSRKRYVKDYRILETIDERGRVSTGTEYIGKHYSFVSGGAALRRDKGLALGSCAIAWLLLLGPLLPRSFAMQAIYVALPFVFCALPLGIATDILLTLCFAKEPLEHRHADKIGERYPAAILAALSLCGASLLGQLLRVILAGGMVGGDWCFFICAPLLLADCLYLFGFKEKLAVREA